MTRIDDAAEDDDCDLCGGCEQVDITSRVDATYSDFFGCPKCMGRQFEADRTDYKARIEELEKMINSPHNDDWFEGVRTETAHQVERWVASHDAGKTPLDWFWLIGYLAQKAASAALAGDTEKAKHHTISTGAALLNWHRHISGIDTRMRPGIQTPKGEENDAT